MAKAKSGGTRSYLRGRVGADVYSIGKDGNGKKQQIVRSLAETVANPRTQAQMVNRMVMSTVMQAVSGLSQLIDHSFDGVANGQPSISEFIRRNYALAKSGVSSTESTNYPFTYVKYGEKGAQPGEYIVSQGNAVLPEAVLVAARNLDIALPSDNKTVGGLKSVLGISGDEYLTGVFIFDNGETQFFRIRVNNAGDDVQITSNTVRSFFSLEGNVTPAISLLEDGRIRFDLTAPAGTAGSACGAIVSKVNGGKWTHSTCVLTTYDNYRNSADMVLPTYPTGEERFLNGGEL